MNDHICAALVAASGDPGTASHEYSRRIWAFCKRNATLRNAIIIATLIRGKVIGNRDAIISQH